MNQETFKTEMMKAQTFRNLGENQDYWIGYTRGLRRAYHGEKFGTDEEHRQWIDSVDSDDPARQARGQGYRDGLNAG